MIIFLMSPLVVCTNAFLTGVFTKLADIAYDDGFVVSTPAKLILVILWGFFGSLVVLGNSYVAAFYLGILLSWLCRYKLDDYSHGIGGSLVFVALLYVRPMESIQVFIALSTFILFTTFGLLSRYGYIQKT